MQTDLKKEKILQKNTTKSIFYLNIFNSICEYRLSMCLFVLWLLFVNISCALKITESTNILFRLYFSSQFAIINYANWNIFKREKNQQQNPFSQNDKQLIRKKPYLINSSHWICAKICSFFLDMIVKFDSIIYEFWAGRVFANWTLKNLAQAHFTNKWDWYIFPIFKVMKCIFQSIKLAASLPLWQSNKCTQCKYHVCFWQKSTHTKNHMQPIIIKVKIYSVMCTDKLLW